MTNRLRKNPVVPQPPRSSLQHSLPKRRPDKRNSIAFLLMRSRNSEPDGSDATALVQNAVDLGDVPSYNSESETLEDTAFAQTEPDLAGEELSATEAAPRRGAPDTTEEDSFPSNIEAASASTQDPIEELRKPENTDDMMNLHAPGQKAAEEVQTSFLLAQHTSKNIDGALAKACRALRATETLRLKDRSLETDRDSPLASDALRTTTTTPTPPGIEETPDVQTRPSTPLSFSTSEKSLRPSPDATSRWTSRVGKVLASPMGYLQHAMELLHKALSIESEVTGKETLSPSRVSTVLLVAGLLPPLILLLVPALVLAVLLVLSCFPVVGLVGIVLALQKLQRQLDHPSASASPTYACIGAEPQTVGHPSNAPSPAQIQDTRTPHSHSPSPVVTGRQSCHQAAQKWGRLQDFGSTCIHYLKYRTQFDVLFFMDAQGTLQPKWIPYIALMLLAATPFLCLAAIPLALALLLLVLILVPVLIAVPILLLLALPCLAFFTFCASVPLLLYLPWTSFRVRMRELMHHAASSTKGLCKLEA